MPARPKQSAAQNGRILLSDFKVIDSGTRLAKKTVKKVICPHHQLRPINAPSKTTGTTGQVGGLFK